MDRQRLTQKELEERFASRSSDEQELRALTLARRQTERARRAAREEQEQYFVDTEPPFEQVRLFERLARTRRARDQRLREANLNPKLFPFGDVDKAIRIRQEVYPRRVTDHTQQAWNNIVTRQIHRQLMREQYLQDLDQLQREEAQWRIERWDSLIESTAELVDRPKMPFAELFAVVDIIHGWIENFYAIPSADPVQKNIFKDDMATIFELLADAKLQKEIIFADEETQGVEVDTQRIAQIWEAVGKQVEIFYDEDTSDERWRSLRDRLSQREEIVFEPLGIYGKQEDD